VGSRPGIKKPGGETSFEASNAKWRGHSCRVEPRVAADAGADERERHVELHRERVVVRRRVRGIPMAVNLPVASFLGVAIRMLSPDSESPGGICIVLEHADPGLSVPLCVAPDGDDVVADWQSWAQVLQMPLLIAEADGTMRRPFPCLGQLRVGVPARRRRGRTAMKRRRPSLLSRRKPGSAKSAAMVHRGREIIARN
jgi:hypothetical protein